MQQVDWNSMAQGSTYELLPVIDTDFESRRSIEIFSLMNEHLNDDSLITFICLK